MEKVGVKLKAIADDKNKTNLFATSTVAILVPKSLALQNIIMHSIKEKTAMQQSSKVTPEWVSDVSFAKKKMTS